MIGVPIFATLSLFPSLAEARNKHVQYTKDKTSRRLEAETDRRDFMRLVISTSASCSVLTGASAIYCAKTMRRI